MSIKLMPHNQQAYTKVKEMLKKENKAAIIQPTGTGKSYIALKLIEEKSDKKIIYLSPSKAIMHQLKKNMINEGVSFKNLTRCTYQKLTALNKSGQLNLEADIIILDEFHHCGAEEWGKAVEELIKQNPQAKILGLSATPIRYFDGNIDMAEELFGENIAIEMTFAEALDKGILPEFEYVCAMYESKGQLFKLKEKIENSKITPTNKKEAQKLFNELAKQINSQTENLPEILEKHMTNKNGKYMIFCSNIEEMHKKIKEAPEIFRKVNPNIKIYNVSSVEDYRDNQRILRKFENDNDENSLKLMFSVNMLNEGYHIPDTDGIIMMRPTKSPIVYTQQIGRALTTCNTKRKPVIIDLVDNFDSIRVIEEATKQWKKNSRKSNRNNTENKTRFKIIDYTKRIFEISEKIVKLTGVSRLKVSEKIDLFERYLKEHPNETIHSDTIYEGYNIGVFLIQIRQAIIYGRSNWANYNMEDFERMKKLGLLYEAKETIYKKAERLKKFCEKYPNAFSYIPKLRKTLNEEEIKELENAVNDYRNIIARKSRGILPKELEEELNNSQIGGVFKSVKEEEFYEKHRIRREDKNRILSEFGNIDNFRKAYIEYMIKLATANDNSEMHRIKMENKKIAKEDSKLPLVRNFYLGYENLEKQRAILKFILFMYGEKYVDNVVLDPEIDTTLEKILNGLTEEERRIAELRFGLKDGKIRTIKEIVDEIGNTSRGMVDQVIKLKISRKMHRRNISDVIFSHIHKPSEEFVRTYFEKMDIFENDVQQLSSKDRKELLNILGIKKEKSKKTKNVIEKNTIEKLNLPTRVYWKIRKIGINTIEELLIKVKCKQDLLDIPGIGSKSADEIIEKIYETIGIKISEEVITRNNHISEETLIRELGLSTRLYNALAKNGISTIGEFREKIKNIEDFRKLKNVGEKSVNEIIDKLRKLSIGTIQNEKRSIENEETVERALEKLRKQEEKMQKLDEKIAKCKEEINLKEESEKILSEEQK